MSEYKAPAYWCPSCRTPSYVGEPDERCDECGHEGAA